MLNPFISERRTIIVGPCKYSTANTCDHQDTSIYNGMKTIHTHNSYYYMHTSQLPTTIMSNSAS